MARRKNKASELPPAPPPGEELASLGDEPNYLDLDGPQAEVPPLEVGPRLGDLIVAARNARGWSRTVLSRMTGLSQNTLAKYERAGKAGGKMPPANKLAVLCYHLQVDPREALLAACPSVFVDGTPHRPNAPMFGEFITGHLEQGNHQWTDAADVMALLRSLYLQSRHELQALIAEVKSLRESGPGRENPSRSISQSKPKHAVGAASKRPKKGGRIHGPGTDGR